MARGDLAEISGSNRQEARERAFRLLAGTVLALVIAFAVLAVVFLWYDSAAKWVTHTHQVRSGVSDVLQSFSDAESSQRAYVLTKEPIFLDRLARSRADAQRQLAEVRELTRDNPPQQKLLADFTIQMNRRLQIIDQVIAVSKTGDTAGALKVGQQAGGRAVMAQARQILKEIDAKEARLEADREDRARTMRLFLAFIAVTFGVLLVALFAKAIRDISLDREVEAETADRLRELVRQRTLLLDEVNHRVKNSLQQIAGIVRLQSRASPEPAVREALEKTLTRIMAVGRVHEQVYKAEGKLGVFDAGSYAEHLARDLVQSMGRDGVVLLTDTESALLDMSHAAPIALILNELITNALKYGCPEGRPCEIKVGFKAQGGDYRLSVSDNGPGMPPGFSPTSTDSLGLRAVEALSRQLGGLLEVEQPAHGTSFAVRFPRRVT